MRLVHATLAALIAAAPAAAQEGAVPPQETLPLPQQAAPPPQVTGPPLQPVEPLPQPSEPLPQQTARPPEGVLAEGGRFDLQATPDGILRTDRQSGTTSICRERGGQWSCELLPDERAALEAEIGRLADENAALRQSLAAEQSGRGEREADRPAIELPSKRDLDQVMGFFETMMRRVFELVQNLKRDFEQQGG